MCFCHRQAKNNEFKEEDLFDFTLRKLYVPDWILQGRIHSFKYNRDHCVVSEKSGAD
jgi:hypothetical protein